MDYYAIAYLADGTEFTKRERSGPMQATSLGYELLRMYPFVKRVVICTVYYRVETIIER